MVLLLHYISWLALKYEPKHLLFKIYFVIKQSFAYETKEDRLSFDWFIYGNIFANTDRKNTANHRRIILQPQFIHHHVKELKKS